MGTLIKDIRYGDRSLAERRVTKRKGSVAGLPETGTPNIIEEPLRTIDDPKAGKKSDRGGKKKTKAKKPGRKR